MRHLTVARPAIAAVLSASALLLVACGSDGGASTQLTPTESLEVTPTTNNPAPETRAVAPKEVPRSDFRDPVVDEGLNVEYHFQGTTLGDYGGTVVSVAVTNLNDVPLPPQELAAPTLRYNAGGGDMEEASMLEVEVPAGSPPVQVPLDLPLGAGATTNLHFTYDVSRGNLWDAEFRIGNVIFTGDLII